MSGRSKRPWSRRMKKKSFIFMSAVIMIIMTRFTVRIVDATVGIDDDIFLLILLLFVINGPIAAAAIYLYKNFFK